MEKDILFYKNYIFKKNNPKHNHYDDDYLLQNINLKLPEDIILYIQQYFTFETKCALLESKYNPLKIMNYLSIFNVHKIINIIFNTDILECNEMMDEETRKIIIFRYEIFYNCKVNENINIRIKRSKYDERIFLKNIVLSFRPTCLNFLYGLYKFIILLYNYENTEK